MNIDMHAYIAILIIVTEKEPKNCLVGLKRIMYVRGGSFARERIVWYL